MPLLFQGRGRITCASWPAVEAVDPSDEASAVIPRAAREALRSAIEYNVAELSWEYSLLGGESAAPMGSVLQNMVDKAKV